MTCKILELLRSIPSGKAGEEINPVLEQELISEFHKQQKTCGGHYDNFSEEETRSNVLDAHVGLVSSNAPRRGRKRASRSLEEKYNHWRYW